MLKKQAKVESFPYEKGQPFLDNLNKNLVRLKERKIAVEGELKKEESYADNIEECKQKLEAIDKKLGVDKHE